MTMQKIINQPIFFALVAVLVVAYSAYLAAFYAEQPPLDVHSFRQTQTALTAYWFIQDGFRLAYETPVAGAPWSIPFEFPLYQLVVAAVSSVLGISLDPVGRVVSYIFLIACLVPVRSITINLKFNKSAYYIFAALLFSSPVYVYWGRTFMIETAALFFAVVAIKYFVDALIDGFDRKNISLFAVFISLSVLQKSTTALPVLAVLSLVYLFYELEKWQVNRTLAWARLSKIAFICFALPLSVGVLWAAFTDHVRLLNPLGEQLSSSALRGWIWGTFEHRVSKALYVDVLWGRIVSANLGSLLGLLFVLLPFIDRNSVGVRIKRIVFVSLMLGVIPLLIFPNLHIVHDYYQSANVIFLIYALAVSLAGWGLQRIGFSATLFALLLILCSNYVMLFSTYMPFIETRYSKVHHDVAIGGILKREIPAGGQFVAFGNGWSSTFSYMAQRKSFTVPEWFKDYSKVVRNPENFVEKGKLGAVVSCPSQSPNVNVKDLLELASKNSWKLGETHGCLVVTPQKKFSADKARKIECRGNLDRVELEQRDGVSAISIFGWSTMSGTPVEFPSSIFVVISTRDSNDRYVEALRVPRPDINMAFGVGEDEDGGFSALLAANNLAPGEYAINVAQAKNGKNEICQFSKKLTIQN